MSEAFNIYCDESGHLEHDHQQVMVLGAVWCPLEKTREIAVRMREIKQRHRLSSSFEIKWVKVSPAKRQFYMDIVDYFFDDDDLHFRALIIPVEGKRFALKRYPMIEGKEATFWHIISEGEIEDERLPDLRRCERIRWPRPMIEAIRTRDVKWWRNKRKEEERVVIALEDFSYVVILADRGDYILLWTAYCVEQEHTRQKLQREYKAYWEEKG